MPAAPPLSRPASGARGGAGDPANAADDAGGAKAEARLKELMEKVPLDREDMAEVKRLVRAVPNLARLGLGAPPVPPPLVPANLEKMPAPERLAALQAFVEGFHYNHTGETYFCIRKNRPLSAIMATAKQMARDRLPIKCLEAVFLGLHITTGLADWERVSIGFKTTVQPPNGGPLQTWRHIVLAVHDKPSGKFGALGLSRRAELAGKPLRYDSLSALLLDYKESYKQWWHTVVKMRIGLPVEHDSFSPFPVCWRCLCVRPDIKAWDTIAKQLDAFPKHWRRLSDRWRANPSKKPTAKALAALTRTNPASAQSAESQSEEEEDGEDDDDDDDEDEDSTSDEEDDDDDDDEQDGDGDIPEPEKETPSVASEGTAPQLASSFDGNATL